MTQYVLKLTLPDGTVRRGSPRDSSRLVARGAARILYDNAWASAFGAQAFSVRLRNTRVGAELVHEPSGYRFRVETEES